MLADVLFIHEIKCLPGKLIATNGLKKQNKTKKVPKYYIRLKLSNYNFIIESKTKKQLTVCVRETYYINIILLK